MFAEASDSLLTSSPVPVSRPVKNGVRYPRSSIYIRRRKVESDVGAQVRLIIFSIIAARYFVPFFAWQIIQTTSGFEYTIFVVLAGSGRVTYTTLSDSFLFPVTVAICNFFFHGLIESSVVDLGLLWLGNYPIELHLNRHPFCLLAPFCYFPLRWLLPFNLPLYVNLTASIHGCHIFGSVPK